MTLRAKRPIHQAQDPDYGFVSGRIRFREKFLLDRERYERLIGEEREEGFLSSLSDTPYAQFKGRNLLEVLKLAEEENHLFLLAYAHSGELLRVLLFPFDLHNLKLKRREKRLGKDLSLYSSPFSYFPYGQIPAEMEETFQRDDLPFDRLEVIFFDQVYSLSLRFPFCAQYLSLLSDIKNILTLVRTIKFGLKSFSFLPHSNFGEDFFFALTHLSLDELPSRLPKIFGEILRESLPFISDGDFGFLRLERRLFSLLLSYLRTTRYLLYGYEVLSSFYLLKRQEILNLRRVYLARFLYGITDLNLLRELVVL